MNFFSSFNELAAHQERLDATNMPQTGENQQGYIGELDASNGPYHTENVKVFLTDGTPVPRKFGYKDANGQEQEYNGFDVSDEEQPYLREMEEIEQRITKRDKELLAEIKQLEQKIKIRQQSPRMKQSTSEQTAAAIQDRTDKNELKKREENWQNEWIKEKQNFKQQEEGLLAQQQNKPPEKQIKTVISDVPRLQQNIPTPTR